MSAYDRFAAFYDDLTQDVQYVRRASTLCDLLSSFGVRDGLVLDLACGTGSMTVEMAKRGYEMIGVDASAEMLCAAQQKAAEAGQSILFLCQTMQTLDLFGTVRGVICTLDSLNHLTKEADLRQTVRRVALFLEAGGVFLFDVNTPYKHREILANNTFVSETDDVYCVWQNELLDADTVRITLDFFEREDDVYLRSTEQFCERAYDPQLLRSVLEEYGFSVQGIYDENDLCAPRGDTQRLIFAVTKSEG
ncbi:MAG: class I SAM-dependent methyltransferase [Clostridia bacterium]|nr:class I SAM-dependent methyltransferase [Clostridia bacterium]